MVAKAHKVAEILAGEGIRAEILNLLTLWPMDNETILRSVKKTGKLLVAHEVVAPCGIGTEVAAIAAKQAFFDLKAPVERVTSQFSPSPFSPELEKRILLNEQDIVIAASRLYLQRESVPGGLPPRSGSRDTLSDGFIPQGFVLQASGRRKKTAR